ncbi:MAG: calcium/sodium antiporter [Collinsella sp.]|nr:calcium/sodium antiporter [Collinsella sp.]
MILQLIFIAVGFALLIGGANLLVDGASQIAQRIGLPDRVIGLTIVAVGTAMPELVVSVASAVEGHADIAFGNVAGSCIANLLLILGMSAIISPLGLSRHTQRFEIPVAVGAVGLLVIFSNSGGALDAVEGAILLACFLAFVAHTVVLGLREGESGQDELDPETQLEPREPTSGTGARGAVASVLFVAIGIALLKFGADLVVDNSVRLAGEVGISERVIGITVIALGTCLPELVTSIVAALRGNIDIAVGNVVGSNISNVLLVMGVPALFSPIVYDTGYNFDFLLLAVFSIMLVGFAFVGVRHTMTRREGVAFVFLYIVYIVISAIA